MIGIVKTGNSPRTDSQTAVTTRRRRVTSSDARCAILNAATQLYSCYGFDAVTVDEVAQQAGVNKMAIYRVFGSRESLTRACIERVNEYELDRWTQAIERESTPRQQILALFTELARRISSDDVTEHPPLRMMMCRMQPAREGFIAHRRQMQALLLRLVTMLGTPNPSALTDALILLWQGVALDLHANDETRRLASHLPALANQLMHLFARDAQ